MNENYLVSEPAEKEIDLMELLYFIWKKIVYVIIATLVCGVFAALISLFLIDPTYQSVTKIYILNKAVENEISVSDLQSGQQLAQDYMELVVSRPVLDEVIEELKLDMTSKQLASCIEVTNKADTRILTISVITDNPALSQDIADSVRKAASLQIKSVTDIDDVTTVETANYPDTKYAPSNTKNTAIGLLLGFVASVGILCIIYITKDKIKSAEDAEKYLGLSTLAVIPDADSLTKKKGYGYGAYTKYLKSHNKIKIPELSEDTEVEIEEIDLKSISQNKEKQPKKAVKKGGKSDEND